MGETKLLAALFNGATYFGSSYGANTGAAFDPVLMDIALGALEKVEQPNLLIIGSWLGRMALPLVNFLNEHKTDWRMTCLEDFRIPVETQINQKCEPTVLSTYYANAARAGVLKNLLTHNLEHMPAGGRIQFIPGPIQETITEFAADSFDLIVIDGPRTLPGFSQILERCRLLGTQGAILCGTGLLLDVTEAHQKGHAHGLGFRISFVHDEKAGIYYYPEISEALNGCCVVTKASGGFWAFLNKSVPAPIEVSAIKRETGQDSDETAFFRLVPGPDSGWLVVHKSVSETDLFRERIGERTLPGIIYVCDDREEALQTALQVEDRERRKSGVLLDETGHYWLGKYGRDVYLAQSKYMTADPPFRLFESRIGDCELRPAILKGGSLAELQEKVAIQESAIIAGRAALACTRSYLDYSIYDGANGLFIAVRIGLKNAVPFASFVGEEDMEPFVLLGNDLEELKGRINRVSRHHEKSPLSGNLDVKEWM